MKHKRNVGKSEQKQVAKPSSVNTVDEIDSDEEPNIANWFWNADGFEFLRFFVIINSLFVFLAMSWPQIKMTLDEAYYYYKDYFHPEKL